MGCANSKQKRCSHCNSKFSSIQRSNSMHVLHPPQSKDDSYHFVALTSTTLGSLDETSHHNYGNNGFIKVSDSDCFLRTQNHDENKNNCSVDVAEEAKAWSNMIEKKLPKSIIPMTPITTPPCEPETINTWELMEGLEDASPLRSPINFRSFSFDVNRNKNHVIVEVDPHRCSFIENDGSNVKHEVSVFDDHVVSSLLQKALKEKQESLAVKGFCLEEMKINGDDGVCVMDFKAISPCRKEKDKVVLYFTSLRGVRKTYEDCCHVRMILKGLGVKVDERDVSMDSGFKEELKDLLGEEFGKGVLLPRVFVGRNYIGGAGEIHKLHEDGKLEKLFACCEKIDDNDDALCQACGDIRFVPCETCNGSCKIYYEDDEEEEENEAEDGEVGEYGFQRCPDCNENGLIRCPICCY
ncbi:putative thioredoxin-like protein [Lupinus albus]|uniref:Putative thioredoxin-like protein n=1 Tax=Lupinus albus TaxID=3870 RepID=A0A6A4R402_LUPAL|nr:putative thioredoxin-like protein [Lupinus albus]